MICDLESCLEIKETVLEDKNCDERCDERSGKTGSSSRVIENYNFDNVDGGRDNDDLKDNQENGTVERSEIHSKELSTESFVQNSKNNNHSRKEAKKYDNKNNTQESLNNNTEEDGSDTDRRIVIANKDNDSQLNGNNNNINKLSAEKENSDKLNMGQAAPNCKRNATDGENVTSERIRNSDGHRHEDKNNRKNSAENNAKFVEKRCTDSGETEIYEDCVILVDGDKNKDVKKETVNLNSENDPLKIPEEGKSTNRVDVCIDVTAAQKKENYMTISKTPEVVQCIAKLEIKPIESEASKRCESGVSVGAEENDKKPDSRKQLDILKKKYVAESHMKIGDEVDRSWDPDVVPDDKGNKQSIEQKVAAESKGALRDTTTHGSIDNRNNVGDEGSDDLKQTTGDIATASECGSEKQRNIECAAQGNAVDEKSNDHAEVSDAIKDSKSVSDEIRTPIDKEVKQVEDSVEESQGQAGKDDGNNGADDDPLSDSGICFYKSKCLLKNPETMNCKEKVKVDESEPSYHEEAPFERRDVVVKKDRWVTDLYAVDSLLGRGKFGEVKKCRERRTGRQLAAKFIEVSGPQDRTDVINEVEIMKHLQHPRLLQLYDAFENRDRFCLVLELVSGGELFERVINDDFILTEKACVMFMRQICDGVAFMHSESILHLDMKPENILCLTREGNRIKIIDFGLAKKYNPKDDLRVLFGTPEFVAPEVVNFDPICPATDMWSVGVICYVLLSGLSPFMGETEAETLSNVTMARWDFNAEEFENISAEAKDFISKLLVKDPRKRISSSLCLDHQWLRRSTKRESHVPERSLSKKRLRKFVYRRKWQKAINAMLALRRMGVSLC